MKIINRLFLIGLMLTFAGVTGCAQNPQTPNFPSPDLLGNSMLQPAPIEEVYYPIPPVKKKTKSTRSTVKTKKTVKKSSTVTSYVTHTVKSGENLYRIALRYGVSQATIKSANGLTSNTLKVGKKLRIPGGKVSGTQTTPPISRPIVSSSVTKTVASSVKKTVAVPSKNIASCSPAPKWGWPSQGSVMVKGAGIHINGTAAQSIKAAASGTVTYSGQGTQKRPNRITISHNKNFSTVYEYYGTSLAKIGSKVALGQTIGQLNSQTPLYFEIRCHAKALNPLYYLPG